jgi:hypothetical protein
VASDLTTVSGLLLLDLSHIRKLYALSMAKLKLSSHYPSLLDSGKCEVLTTLARLESYNSQFDVLSLSVNTLQPEETVALCCSTRFYDQAVSLSILFDLRLDSVLESLTIQCLKTAKAGERQ